MEPHGCRNLVDFSEHVALVGAHAHAGASRERYPRSQGQMTAIDVPSIQLVLTGTIYIKEHASPSNFIVNLLLSK